MKRYTNQYRNQQYLYTVYGDELGDDYILVAVVPAVGWYNIALRLSKNELELLREGESRFTAFVNDFLAGHESPRFKSRRIERLIEDDGVDAIVVR